MNLRATSQALVSEMRDIYASLLNDAEGVSDLKILHTTLTEMSRAFQVFAPYRHVRKVSVFGSARNTLTDEVYAQAAAFGQKIVGAGFMVITGAGDGIMRAVQGGAGRADSFGMNILLPFEQEANEFIENDKKLATFKYFFARKLFFVREAHAIVLFPGGFGTHDEGFETLTLLQTGKSVPMPLVMVDQPRGTYWTRWREYVVSELLGRGLIEEEDVHLFRIVYDVEEAVAEITRFYRTYHSMRFVNGQLILRLEHAVGTVQMEQLNRDFSDIVLEGRITETAPLPEEADEPHLSALPRITFSFNKKNFGRLRQMIDAINCDTP